MLTDSLLAACHLSVLGSDADPELEVIRDTIAAKALVSGRGELEALLSRLIASAANGPVMPKTLDLIGHAVPGSCLLTLGSMVLDTENPIVTSYFRGLAEHDVLPRLGIHAVRLIGSMTGATPQGQATMCALSDILGVEVYGTRNLIYAAHFNSGGFADAQEFLLVHSSDVRRAPASSQPLLSGGLVSRTLDLDAVPAVTVAELGHARVPRQFASREATGDVLRLIRRDDARAMPGLLLEADGEVALPSAVAGTYHRAQVLLDGAFVRFPALEHDASGASGLCYAVSSPHELVALVGGLSFSAPA